MAASRHLGFGATENSAIRSADLENPTLDPHEVDRMTHCRDMAVRNFPKCEVGRSSILRCSHTLLFATLGTYLCYVRNVAREE